MKKNSKSINKEKYSELFVYLSTTFVVCLLLSNILAAKILALGTFSVTAGVLIFPISYIINDILSEVYGYDKAKKIIIVGFVLELLMILLFSLAIVLPAPVWYENSEAFATILGSTPRIAFAGLVSYLFGSLVNSKVLVKMKDKNDKLFGIRAIISTLFGEFVDSLLFVPLAFYGTMSIVEIVRMIIILVIVKTLYETICLPITYKLVCMVKKYENN